MKGIGRKVERLEAKGMEGGRGENVVLVEGKED